MSHDRTDSQRPVLTTQPIREQYSTHYSPGTTVKWSCSEGYTLFGSSVSMCYNAVLVPLPVYSLVPVCLPGCAVPKVWSYSCAVVVHCAITHNSSSVGSLCYNDILSDSAR